MMRRIAWALWAMLPVLGMVYHFGAGQQGLRRDAAARALVDARAAAVVAADAQAVAHASQLDTIAARERALLSGREEDEHRALEALEIEKEKYAVASDAWKVAADRYSAVEELLSDSEEGIEIRWAKASALVRAGEIWNGIDELQAIVDGAELEGRGDEALVIAAREELAAAHYYGARILREEGRPTDLWRGASGMARQQYRYLAENAAARDEPALAGDLQRNLERVLDLEQLERSELVARPLPKDSPRGRRPGDRDPGNGRGRSRRPPQNPGGNGAGGLLEIGPGW